jgi:hypothetical protein
MTIYVIVEEMPRESCHVAGVYHTREDAQEEIERILGTYSENTGAVLITYFHKTFRIEEWKVL